MVRFLRRFAALFLATLALWCLSLTAGVTAAPLGPAVWAEQGGLIEQTVAAQLPLSVPEEAPAWKGLVLNQSAVLSAGVVASIPPVPSAQPQASPAPSLSPNDDPEDVPVSPPAASQSVVGKSMAALPGAGVYGENGIGEGLDIAALAAAPLELSLSREGPQVLILHTHGTEAYTPTGEEDTYTAYDNCRTTDADFNVLRVGEEIKGVLEEMGLTVLHDTGLYDYPQYSGAYDRSQAAVEGYLAQYPTIQVVLDVHRDAIVGEDGVVYKPVTTIGGEATAQIELVMGTDTKFDHPNWHKNLALALQVQQSMNTLWPSLARPIVLRANRYNQQLCPGSLLVEVGSHGSSREEALAAARMFARSLGAVLAPRLEGAQ